jgi:hypothetical protein
MGAGYIISGVLITQKGGSSLMEFGTEGLQDLVEHNSGDEWTKRVILRVSLALNEVAGVAIRFVVIEFVGIPRSIRIGVSASFRKPCHQIIHSYSELTIHLPFSSYMARTLVKQEYKIEVRGGSTKTIDCIFELQFHVPVGPISFMILPVPERFEER